LGSDGVNEKDLSVTALYTSGAWSWGKLANAELVLHPRAPGVFSAVNATLAMTRPFAREAPLKIALLHRHVLIDALLEESRAPRVLELAAGLSRRGITFSESREYVEVDRPHVVEAKRALLERTDAGRAALARSTFRMIGADVTDTPLDELAPPNGEPLFVIAEGLMMYLDADAQRALARRVAERLAKGGGTFVFDLVPPCEQPPPGAVGRALEWTMKQFTGGKAFAKDARTRDDIAGDLRACGFARVEAVEPRAVATKYALPYPDAPTQQLVFVASGTPD
jgi:O-methyltransferase involved in polyketide biosynthesis